MAGLLQYSFFPTDFYYPPPSQSWPAIDSTPPIKKINLDDNDGNRQVGIVVYSGDKMSVSVWKQGGQPGRICMQNQAEHVKLSRN